MEEVPSRSELNHCVGEPFRLMDLPAELREMIYYRAPRIIKHHTIPAARGPSLVIVSRSMPLAFLVVSKTIHMEASSIVLDIAKAFILNRTMQFILPFSNYKLVQKFHQFLQVVVLLVHGADKSGSLVASAEQSAADDDGDLFNRMMEKDIPKRLHHLVYSNATRFTISTVRKIHIVLAGDVKDDNLHGRNEKFQLIHNHTAHHNLRYFEDRDPEYWPKNFEISYAGLKLFKPDGTSLKISQAPWSLQNADFSNSPLSTLGNRAFAALPSMSQETWESEWLESST